MNPFRYGEIVTKSDFCARPVLGKRLRGYLESGTMRSSWGNAGPERRHWWWNRPVGCVDYDCCMPNSGRSRALTTSPLGTQRVSLERANSSDTGNTGDSRNPTPGRQGTCLQHWVWLNVSNMLARGLAAHCWASATCPSELAGAVGRYGWDCVLLTASLTRHQLAWRLNLDIKT